MAAALLAHVVISLASSWAVVETLGWWKESFFWVHVLESFPAVVVPILYPNDLNLLLSLMVVFVFVLAGPGILMGRLSSSKKIMGDLTWSKGWKLGYWLSLALVLSFGFAALFAAL